MIRRTLERIWEEDYTAALEQLGNDFVIVVGNKLTGNKLTWYKTEKEAREAWDDRN